MHLFEDHTENSFCSQKGSYAVARAWMLMAIPEATRTLKLSSESDREAFAIKNTLTNSRRLTPGTPQNISSVKLNNVLFCLQMQFLFYSFKVSHIAQRAAELMINNCWDEEKGIKNKNPGQFLGVRGFFPWTENKTLLI